MSHGLDIDERAPVAAPAIANPLVRGLARAINAVNMVIVRASQIALIVAACILSYSVALRYFFKGQTYWQDEAAVFLLVGATFLSSAYVQERRGHIGIEAIVGLLPRGVEKLRRWVVDVASMLFCAFFAWKSWTLLEEAWVDGQVSGSTWAPPLWIPYSVMALGMTLLSLQILVQVLTAISGEKRA